MAVTAPEGRLRFIEHQSNLKTTPGQIPENLRWWRSKETQKLQESILFDEARRLSHQEE